MSSSRSLPPRRLPSISRAKTTSSASRRTWVVRSLAQPSSVPFERAGANAELSSRSASTGRLLCGKTSSTFSRGVLNFHCGDLPRYRGNACPNWAILAGEDRVVLTVHQMAEQLDAGPIVVQDSFPLTERSYIADVYAYLNERVPGLIAEAVDALAEGRLIPRAQSPCPEDSLRCFPRIPRDGYLDWSTDAQNLARLVRASGDPFAGAFTFLEGELLRVWRARPGKLAYPWLGCPGQVAEIDRTSGEVTILTGRDVLVLEQASREGGIRTFASDILKSTRIRLGIDWTQAIRTTSSRKEARDVH